VAAASWTLNPSTVQNRYCQKHPVARVCRWQLTAPASLQIVVPPDLADVLKAYTKDVIRNQPTDLIAYSAK
jgi:hypothetical protein